MKLSLFLLLVIFPWKSALATLPIYNLVAPHLINATNLVGAKEYSDEIRACQSMTNAKLDFEARPEAFLKNLVKFQESTKSICGSRPKISNCSQRIILEKCYVGFRDQLLSQESATIASHTRKAKASPSRVGTSEESQEVKLRAAH